MNLFKSLQESICNSPNYKWWALLVVQFGIFFVGVSGTIVNLALPSISLYFSSHLAITQLVIIVYSAAIAIFLPLAGQLPRYFGRKPIVIGGFALFTLGSILAALAPTIEMLIAFQVILGVGSAALLANSNAITHTVFPKEQHGLAMGINGTVAAIGYGVGLVVGGYLIELFEWRSIYWLNLPFGFFALVSALLILSEEKISIHTQGQEIYSFDYWGFLFFAGAIGSFILALEIQMSYALIFGSICLCLFILRESKTLSPLIDLKLFKLSSLSIGSTNRWLITSVVSGCFLLIPFYAQKVLGLSPLESGTLMATFSIALFFSGPVGGKISDKWGSVWATSCGFLLCGAALLILATLNSISADSLNGTKISIAMFLLGWGFGFFVPSNNSSTLNSIPSVHVGVVSGFLWSIAYLGTATGTGLAVYMLLRNGIEEGIEPAIEDSSKGDFLFLDAQTHTLYILLGFSLVGFLLCLLRHKISKNGTQKNLSK